MDSRDAKNKCKEIASDTNLDGCSICLEHLGNNDGDRTTVTLQCNHRFHLDCIGSAFNAKNSMQCPICRRIEPGQWRYATGFAIQNFNAEDPIDPLGMQLSPFRGFGQHNIFDPVGRPNSLIANDPMASLYRSNISAPNVPFNPFAPTNSLVGNAPRIPFHPPLHLGGSLATIPLQDRYGNLLGMVPYFPHYPGSSSVANGSVAPYYPGESSRTSAPMTNNPPLALPPPNLGNNTYTPLHQRIQYSNELIELARRFSESLSTTSIGLHPVGGNSSNQINVEPFIPPTQQQQQMERATFSPNASMIIAGGIRRSNNGQGNSGGSGERSGENSGGHERSSNNGQGNSGGSGNSSERSNENSGGDGRSSGSRSGDNSGGNGRRRGSRRGGSS